MNGNGTSGARNGTWFPLLPSKCVVVFLFRTLTPVRMYTAGTITSHTQSTLLSGKRSRSSLSPLCVDAAGGRRRRRRNQQAPAFPSPRSQFLSIFLKNEIKNICTPFLPKKQKLNKLHTSNDESAATAFHQSNTHHRYRACVSVSHNLINEFQSLLLFPTRLPWKSHHNSGN